MILLPDSGRAYLSTYFNPQWLSDNGFGASDEKYDEADLVTADEGGAVAAARLVADGAAQDTPVLVVYRRIGRVLAPHPSDVLGWVTPALLREHATARDAAQAFDPDTVSPVLRNGRIAGVVHTVPVAAPA